MAEDWKGGGSKRYKVPVSKTPKDEAFLKWINTHSNKNRLITDALRALYMLETSGSTEDLSRVGITEKEQSEIPAIDPIGMNNATVTENIIQNDTKTAMSDAQEDTSEMVTAVKRPSTNALKGLQKLSKS